MSIDIFSPQVIKNGEFAGGFSAHHLERRAKFLGSYQALNLIFNLFRSNLGLDRIEISGSISQEYDDQSYYSDVALEKLELFDSKNNPISDFFLLDERYSMNAPYNTDEPTDEDPAGWLWFDGDIYQSKDGFEFMFQSGYQHHIISRKNIEKYLENEYVYEDAMKATFDWVVL